MATGSSTDHKSCCQCSIRSTDTCNGCHQVFCSDHIDKHYKKISKQMNNIERENEVLKQDLTQQTLSTALTDQIDQWETASIEKIKSAAQLARTDVQKLSEESNHYISNLINKLSNDLQLNQKQNECNEYYINQWKEQLNKIRLELEKYSKMELFYGNGSPPYMIKIEVPGKTERNQVDKTFPNVDRSRETPAEIVISSRLSTDTSLTMQSLPLQYQMSAYPSELFGLNQSNQKKINSLFEHLMRLNPMDKNGPMSGKCDRQTDQMNQFLSQTFGFKNIPDKYIVQGVKSFELKYPPDSMNSSVEISFPTNTIDAFTMTVEEIVRWQHSFRVYADVNIKGMNKKFLKQALKGKSKDGKEAFRMKFVVRISTCPILMEFDAKVISRNLEDKWPNRIKLVSVTGIDFAGRKHDVGDILYYLSNWRKVFYTDQTTGLPSLYNARDFHQRPDAQPGKIQKERVRDSLMRMTRIRLQACDKEGVQIVVETGIGLGVFAGSQIGIDAEIRALSAEAIRKVLEQDGPSYTNILAIVFALPIFNKSGSNHPVSNTYDDYVNEFQQAKYKGPIPVLIADQDMHRLTVAIARQGFIVSELNPADSHGVFGEYWQNRGPAVEEKLALTTAGLLVQHHLINREVLDDSNYRLIEINDAPVLDWKAAMGGKQ
ncbi:unnamed protein product [Rotaria socialis]